MVENYEGDMMVLIETTDEGKDVEVLALSALVGIGCKGFTFKAKDFEDILTLDNESIRRYLEHLTTRLLPEV